jgi:hypothetical protein
MKRVLSIGGITLAVCTLACAQESRVSVPVKNGAHTTVEVLATHSSVIVKTGGSEVVAEADGPRARQTAVGTRTPPGMHRIDVPRDMPLRLEQNGNVVRVVMTPRLGANTLNLTVPPDTTVKINSTHGNITAERVSGEVDVSSTHGNIDLSDISGTVVANSMHGSMHISMRRVDQSKPLSFTTMMGDIDITLPADVKANLKTRALRGQVWTDFDLKTRNSATGGTINGGGVDMSFYTVNGKITIHKK